jgi:hypothetical protein
VLGGLAAKNPALWWVTSGTLGGVAVLFAIPATRDLFQFALVRASDFGVAALVGAVSVMWFEAYKVIQRRRRAQVG